MKKYILLIAFVALVVSGCATTSAPPDLKAVWYSGGSFQSQKFKDCVSPSTRDYSPGDHYFYYPTRQISYEASSDSGAETKAFTVVSQDNAQLFVPVRLTFHLDTDCKVLRKFHEQIGSRYEAFIDNDKYDDNAVHQNDDGKMTSADYTDGWVRMLNDIVGKPLNNTLVRIAQKYPWQKVWNDDAVRQEMTDEIQSTIEEAVADQAGGDFFTGFTALVQKPDPVDQSLVDAFSQKQAAITQAQADTAKAKADKTTAKAQERLADAQAKTKQAEIDGFGGIQNYLRYTCITEVAGCNPWQPTYLYGGSPQAAAPSQ